MSLPVIAVVNANTRRRVIEKSGEDPTENIRMVDLAAASPEDKAIVAKYAVEHRGRTQGIPCVDGTLHNVYGQEGYFYVYVGDASDITAEALAASLRRQEERVAEDKLQKFLLAEAETKKEQAEEEALRAAYLAALPAAAAAVDAFEAGGELNYAIISEAGIMNQYFREDVLTVQQVKDVVEVVSLEARINAEIARRRQAKHDAAEEKKAATIAARDALKARVLRDVYHNKADDARNAEGLLPDGEWLEALESYLFRNLDEAFHLFVKLTENDLPQENKGDEAEFTSYKAEACTSAEYVRFDAIRNEALLIRSAPILDGGATVRAEIRTHHGWWSDADVRNTPVTRMGVLVTVTHEPTGIEFRREYTLSE